MVGFLLVDQAVPIPSVLLGQYAGLAICLVALTLFYTGRILSRNTVPREDYKVLLDINAGMAERFQTVTTALNELVAVVRHAQKNGGL